MYWLFPRYESTFYKYEFVILFFFSGTIILYVIASLVGEDDVICYLLAFYLTKSNIMHLTSKKIFS